MQVDEKGLEAAARAIDPKAWHAWDNRHFPRDLPRHLDNRGHRLTPSLDSARAAIEAYLSARSAEPVAGLTPAEQKAQGARCSCRGVDDYCPCQNVPDEKIRRARALSELAAVDAELL